MLPKPGGVLFVVMIKAFCFTFIMVEKKYLELAIWTEFRWCQFCWQYPHHHNHEPAAHLPSLCPDWKGHRAFSQPVCLWGLLALTSTVNTEPTAFRFLRGWLSTGWGAQWAQSTQACASWAGFLFQAVGEEHCLPSLPTFLALGARA